MKSLPYPVELKINLSGSVDQALESLDLDDARQREVWFLEDDTPGLLHEMPLLRASVILRLRTDSKRDQSTVKLRPARRSQLTGRWVNSFKDDGVEYRIESDWAGERKVLSASCVAEFPPDTFDQLLTGDGDLSGAFTDRQLQFLAECVDVRIAIGGLTPFGPIGAIQWKDQQLGSVEVDVERWTVGDHDSLELSARADAESLADDKYSAMKAAVLAHNLTVAAGQAPKTETVLRYLMHRRRP